jgi:hypothetical protein
MSYTLLQNANLGPSRANLTGSGGVGYTVLDQNGAVIIPRTTAGVYQLASGSGIYAAYVTYPDNFKGQILWDAPTTGSLTQVFAVEDQNYLNNNPTVDEIYTQLILVSGSVDFIRHIEGGRWKISGNQMTFYAENNSTVIATFDLYDQFGSPTDNEVMERRRV